MRNVEQCRGGATWIWSGTKCIESRHAEPKKTTGCGCASRTDSKAASFSAICSRSARSSSGATCASSRRSASIRIRRPSPGRAVSGSTATSCTKKSPHAPTPFSMPAAATPRRRLDSPRRQRPGFSCSTTLKEIEMAKKKAKKGGKKKKKKKASGKKKKSLKTAGKKKAAGKKKSAKKKTKAGKKKKARQAATP